MEEGRFGWQARDHHQAACYLRVTLTSHVTHFISMEGGADGEGMVNAVYPSRMDERLHPGTEASHFTQHHGTGQSVIFFFNEALHRNKCLSLLEKEDRGTMQSLHGRHGGRGRPHTFSQEHNGEIEPNEMPHICSPTVLGEPMGKCLGRQIERKCKAWGGSKGRGGKGNAKGAASEQEQAGHGMGREMGATAQVCTTTHSR